ncbi:hypothetical protein ACHAWF_003062 [Thalassiosira exigua]
MFVDKGIEAYHVDEHRTDADAKLLQARLDGMTQAEIENLSIVLFVNPQKLTANSIWTRLLHKLAARDAISLLCIDEAHTVNLQGRSFRPEFEEAVKTMKSLYDSMPNKCPRVAMSATFCQGDQDRISELLGKKPDFVVWTSMNRRRFFFEVVGSGNPTQTTATCIGQDLERKPEMKVIWYTNSKRKAEDSMVPAAENALDRLGIDGESMPCTGDCGIAPKGFVTAAFRGDKELFSRPQRAELADAVIDDEMCDQANLRILPATAAANCGISSDLCERCYRVGLPPNLYDLVQEMGRCDRTRLLPADENRCEIHVSFPIVIDLYVRIMKQKDKAQRERELVALFQVLQLALTPKDCFHIAMERFFEQDRPESERTPCRHYCSFCTGGHDELTGVFRRKELSGLLVSKCFNGSSPTHKDFPKFIKGVKNDIYEPGEAPDEVVGPIHALCLQMVANGIVDLAISDAGRFHIGTDKLDGNHVVVKLGVSSDGMPFHHVLAHESA